MNSERRMFFRILSLDAIDLTVCLLNNNLAVVLRNFGNYEKAKALLEKADTKQQKKAAELPRLPSIMNT